jgi:hypothetical protein
MAALSAESSVGFVPLSGHTPDVDDRLQPLLSSHPPPP